MKDFFKYISVGVESSDWGLFLNVVGKSSTLPNQTYPLKEHPSGYFFNFNKGRIINEYQLNYITEGSGFFETKEESYKINAGTMLIIRKNQWHRYRPEPHSGWTEHYVGFDGAIADHFLSQKSISNGRSVIFIGKHEVLIDIYYRVFRLVIDENPGYQEISSGLILELLGYIAAFQKHSNFNSKPLELAIQAFRFEMRSNFSKMPDINIYAENSRVSADYFRIMFKKYTGFSPHQYFINLKILRAKELLLISNKSIKEISYDLGFQSSHYFSRLFHKKTGVYPSKLRN